MKILYVEDDEVQQRSLRRLAINLGCEVVLADDGESGYRLAQDSALNLIFVDFNLPDMDGLALIQRLRAENVQVPIVAATGDLIQNTEAMALEAGCTAFLAKPFEQSLLLSTLKRYWVS